MRVISQGGMFDIPYEISSLNMGVGKYKDVVNVSIYCGNSFSTAKMAEYSSKEKAKKAMQMLREAYEAQFVEFEDGFYQRGTIFQFPKDEEIEV